MFDVPLKPSTSLKGSIDLEALVAAYPSNYVLKGMFCNRLVDVLGDDFHAMHSQLIAPPRGGRYLPFKDYPQSDYTRLVIAAATKQHPDQSLAEATRLVAREDFATFAASTLGKVTLTLVGDPHNALLRMPEAYPLILGPGPELLSEERDPSRVRMTLLRYCGAVEYMLGQFEGIVMAYGRSPVITVQRPGGRDTVTFDVGHH